MTLVTVTNTPHDALGAPIPNAPISITLCVSAFDSSGAVEVIGLPTYVTTDANGLWTLTAVPNSELTPAGTFYTIREPGGTVHVVTVPPGGPYLLSALPVVTSPPLPPSSALYVQADVVQTFTTAQQAQARANIGATAGGGGVTSFNTRVGAVVPASGDYTAAQVGADAAGAATTAQAAAIAAAASDATTKANTAQTNAQTYADTNKLAKSTVTTKGDLIVGTGAGAVTNLPVGADGQVPVADSTQAGGVKWASAGPPSPFYGDGSDGNVTIATTVQMTRDMHYDTLTINSGGILQPHGFRIFARTAIVINAGGSIDRSGGNASGASGGSGDNNNQASLGYCPSFQVSGGTGAGASGANAVGVSGSGGNGGAGAGNAGGSGGTSALSNTTATSTASLRNPVSATLGVLNYQVNGAVRQDVFGGGCSGGAGGGDGTQSGGGSGGGGGVIVIAAKKVTNSGTITANGGNGATPGFGNTGGGGGGGGGTVLIVTTAFTGGAPTVTAGTAGAGRGTGSAGTNGAAGFTAIIQGV